MDDDTLQISAVAADPVSIGQLQLAVCDPTDPEVAGATRVPVQVATDPADPVSIGQLQLAVCNPTVAEATGVARLPVQVATDTADSISIDQLGSAVCDPTMAETSPVPTGRPLDERGRGTRLIPHALDGRLVLGPVLPGRGPFSDRSTRVGERGGPNMGNRSPVGRGRHGVR